MAVLNILARSCGKQNFPLQLLDVLQCIRYSHDCQKEVAYLPKLLKDYRKAAGLTTRQLADLVGVSHGKIEYLERQERKTTQELVGKIAFALNIDSSELKYLVNENDLDDTESLKSLRMKAGLSRAELAEAIHLTVRAVAGLERANRVHDPDILAAVSTTLGVPLDSLSFLCPPDSVRSTLKGRRCQAGL